MTAIERIPTNRNFLSPLNFKFQVKKTPNVEFFIQTVNIPAMSIQAVTRGTPFIALQYSGEHIDYAPLQITFKVDEELVNYMELYSWLRGLGFPNEFSEYKELADKPQYTGEGIRSDISLLILSSDNNVKYEVLFKDAFPVSLSDITFDVRGTSVNYITASAQFKFNSYDILTV